MGIAERAQQRAMAGDRLTRTPSMPDPNAKQIVKATRKASKPPGDDRARIGYVSIGDILQSVAIDEESAGLIVVEGRKARGVQKPFPTTRESKGKNSIGRKLAHAWANAADRQHSGEASDAERRHWRDMKGGFWAPIVGRSLKSSEVKSLDNAEQDRGFYFAASIAAKYRR